MKKKTMQNNRREKTKQTTKRLKALELFPVFFSRHFFLAANILYINKHSFGDGISRACNNGILNEVNAPHKICFLSVHLLFMLLRYDAICASLINGKECEVKGVCVIQSLSLDCVVYRTA